MESKYLDAVQKLKEIFEPLTDEFIHIDNVNLARLTFPYNHIPYSAKPEEWKLLTHPDFFVNRYLVSSWGRIYDLLNEYYLTSSLCEKGYVRVTPAANPKANKGKSICLRAHRLVGLTFLPLIKDKLHINHMDLNKRNNTLENLEWVSDLENREHAILNGAVPKGGHSFFTKEEIQDIRKKYQEGKSISALRREYNRKDCRTISDIVKYKSYNDDFWDNVGFPNCDNNHYSKYRQNL